MLVCVYPDEPRLRLSALLRIAPPLGKLFSIFAPALLTLLLLFAHSLSDLFFIPLVITLTALIFFPTLSHGFVLDRQTAWRLRPL